ncbi:MAG: DUF2058 family protein [Planctomycetota bacterium]
MGDLRDELRKAGLLSDKDIRRVHQEEQQKKKVLGKEGVEAADRRRKEEAAARNRQQAERDRELARRQQSERDRRDAAARQRAAIESAILRDVGGPRRFHFVTRASTIVFLEVSLDIARRLEAGELAIIEKPSDAADGRLEEHGIVPREIARQLSAVDRDSVRFASGA